MAKSLRARAMETINLPSFELTLPKSLEDLSSKPKHPKLPSLNTLFSSDYTNSINLPSNALMFPKSFEDLTLTEKNIRFPSLSTLFPLDLTDSAILLPTNSLANSVYSRSIAFPIGLYCRKRSSSVFSHKSERPLGVKAKRKRASAVQIEHLNHVFLETPFPSTELRKELGAKLSMDPRAVQIWFQNRRQAIKGRKNVEKKHYNESMGFFKTKLFQK